MLKLVLMVSDKASRLLLTSRNRAMNECSQFVHLMMLLNTNQSWKLFMRKAFIHNTDGKCPDELQIIGEKILKWCGGLPLAICLVGGLLQKKTPPRKGEWEKVAKEMKSHLERNNDINTISAILELSYHNLPPELKACFLFLGFFKEGAVIEAKDLIHIWVAQGLVAQEVVGEEETMEDVAKDYLNQLISRNIVQVKSREYGVVKECQMHDLLRDLSQRKAKEEINLEVTMGDSQHPFLDKPRHCVMHCSQVRSDSIINTYIYSLVTADYTNQNVYLRSLFVNGEYNLSSSYWKSFELLKVLDWGNVKHIVLPEAIGAVTGLRYIKIMYEGPTSKLPRPWGKLTNLQVLHLWGDGDIIIDKVILKMKSLRHLYAKISISSLSKEVSLANMKTLQMTLRYNMSGISDASELFTYLASLGNIVSLTLTCCSEIVNMEGLSALHRVTELTMDNLESLPTSFPPKLCYMTLSDMRLNEDPMPVLESLPELLYLKLERGILGNQEMVIKSNGFPQLKVFHLERMGVRNVQVEKGGMPKLKQLFIHHCPDLNLPEQLKSAITDV